MDQEPQVIWSWKKRDLCLPVVVFGSAVTGILLLSLTLILHNWILGLLAWMVLLATPLLGMIALFLTVGKLKKRAREQQSSR